MAMPVNLPFSSGITRPTAFAPVDVEHVSAGTGAIEVAMRLILHALVVGVSMNGGHQTGFDAKRIVEYFRNRCEAVGGAACVRNAFQVRRQLVIVDTQHACQVSTIFRRADDHFFGTGGKVGVVTRLGVGGTRRENSRRYDGDIDIQIAPGQLAGITLCKDRDALTVDGETFVIVIHGPIKSTMNAVVFQRGQRLIVVDR